MNWQVRKLIITDFTCGPGMKKQSGREVGKGGLEGGLFAYTFQECIELCKSRPKDCTSVMYSNDRQHCKIMAHSKPAKNTNHQDFVWCSVGSTVLDLSYFVFHRNIIIKILRIKNIN